MKMVDFRNNIVQTSLPIGTVLCPKKKKGGPFIVESVAYHGTDVNGNSFFDVVKRTFITEEGGLANGIQRHITYTGLENYIYVAQKFMDPDYVEFCKEYKEGRYIPGHDSVYTILKNALEGTSKFDWTTDPDKDPEVEKPSPEPEPPPSEAASPEPPSDAPQIPCPYTFTGEKVTKEPEKSTTDPYQLPVCYAFYKGKNAQEATNPSPVPPQYNPKKKFFEWHEAHSPFLTPEIIEQMWTSYIHSEIRANPQLYSGMCQVPTQDTSSSTPNSS